jgi:hypothetical protein
MSYPINYPTPQGANVQIFQAPNRSGANNGVTWVKPQGASFVWFTLIGAGGNGDGVNGGGSGAVTNFMCPAFLIPDELSIRVGSSSATTAIRYQQKDGTGYLLLQAESGTGVSGGAATGANAFTAMGFYQSVAGQDGGTGARPASATTFLSAGTDATGTVTANYGYTNPYTVLTGNNGFFQLQPIIVGVGSNSTSSGVTRSSGIGCGGGASNTNGIGGPGMVVIITW